MNSEFKSIRETVLTKIKSEHVRMHSRAYFALKLCILAVVTLLVLFISVGLCNFLIFAIEASGRDVLLGFGNRGLFMFVRFFPWWLLVLDIALIVLLEWLLRRFRFGYRAPVLFLLLGVLVVTISVAVTIERMTSVNAFLRDRAHERRLPPPFNDFFERSGRPAHGHDAGMCRCTVVRVEGNTIIADDFDIGTTTRLAITVPESLATATSSGLKAGDIIFVAGDREGNTIKAFGIKKLRAGFAPPAGGYLRDPKPRDIKMPAALEQSI